MDVVVPPEFQPLYVTDRDHPIVKIPEPVLRKKAVEVTKFGKRIQQLGDNMVRLMKAANGVGLAGPQVGVLERIIVIHPGKKPIVLVNPVIVKREGEEIGEEGCLSIPGLYGDVKRSEFIEVEALTLKGDPVAYEMEGYAARIVQHEVDHLDGILFIDKVDLATLHWMNPNERLREGQ
ncbi:MAG: peptide deformylase [Fimbriimonadaceae bacterium]|jgi:peptide deformylase|nr:peptide deformylase [Fimbriimonadaceae bacterium]